MIVPADKVFQILDAVCAEAERHRLMLAGATVPFLAMSAVTPAGGFLNLLGIGSGTFCASGSGIGYVSRWRGWVDED